MNRNVLKYIAIIAMTLDHVAVHLDFISPTIYLIFRIIGRITMPIMCFFIVEGFFYTKSKKNYALRLLILAIISQPIWCLLHNDTILTWEIFLNLNTVFSLLLGFLLLWIIEGNQKLYIKSLLIVLVVTCSFLCDYKLVALLYVVFFYLTRDNKYKFVYKPRKHWETLNEKIRNLLTIIDEKYEETNNRISAVELSAYLNYYAEKEGIDIFIPLPEEIL